MAMSSDSPPKVQNTRRTRIGLLLFIISPLAVVTLLCVLIARSLERGPEMHEPPVGAGAGHTGMSNEYMKKHAPK